MSEKPKKELPPLVIGQSNMWISEVMHRITSHPDTTEDEKKKLNEIYQEVYGNNGE